MHEKKWYEINTLDTVDSPALVIYLQRVEENIATVKKILPDLDRLRPHVKTHKSGEITKLLLNAGINKFKCATIAEAEMLAMAGARDILLAYQPVGPKLNRLIALIKNYPRSTFSCLIDDLPLAKTISDYAKSSGISIPVFIDVNVGMNRTGISPNRVGDLYDRLKNFSNISVKGLHVYDGHLRDSDLSIRTKACDEAFEKIDLVRDELEKKHSTTMVVVAGGTPTFPIHAKRKNVECSPGTFIYWDKGYQTQLPEQPFLCAALVITRVVSKPDDETVCVDLGHKSIASENTMDKRVYFLNAPELQPIGHSEEHLVLRASKNNTYKVGDVLYGVPHHICPTVALYDLVHVVQNNLVVECWNTLSRNRKINI